MLWLRLIGKILKTLKEGATPAQIALGFVLGWGIGLIPGWPVQVWALVLLLLVLQANITMAFVAVAIAAGLAWLLDPVLNSLGAAVLSIGALQGPFTTMFNSPPWGLTRFNNTVVMGAGVAAGVSMVILFPLIVVGVRYYRERLLTRLARFRLVQMLMGSRLVGWYRRLEELGLV